MILSDAMQSYKHNGKDGWSFGEPKSQKGRSRNISQGFKWPIFFTSTCPDTRATQSSIFSLSVSIYCSMCLLIKLATGIHGSPRWQITRCCIRAAWSSSTMRFSYILIEQHATHNTKCPLLVTIETDRGSSSLV